MRIKIAQGMKIASLMTLPWKDYPGSFTQAQCNHKFFTSGWIQMWRLRWCNEERPYPAVAGFEDQERGALGKQWPGFGVIHIWLNGVKSVKLEDGGHTFGEDKSEQSHKVSKHEIYIGVVKI